MTDEDEPITAMIARDGDALVLAFDDGSVPEAGEFVDLHRIRFTGDQIHDLLEYARQDGVGRMKIESSEWCRADEVKQPGDSSDGR